MFLQVRVHSMCAEVLQDKLLYDAQVLPNKYFCYVIICHRYLSKFPEESGIPGKFCKKLYII